MDYNDDLPRQARQCRDAADLIRNAGHCKGALSNIDNQHCIVGALMAVDNGNLPCRVVSEIERVISEQYAASDASVLLSGVYFSDIVDWNNRAQTTGDDVVSVLEKAAARLEECA